MTFKLEVLAPTTEFQIGVSPKKQMVLTATSKKALANAHSSEDPGKGTRKKRQLHHFFLFVRASSSSLPPERYLDPRSK